MSEVNKCCKDTLSKIIYQLEEVWEVDSEITGDLESWEWYQDMKWVDELKIEIDSLKSDIEDLQKKLEMAIKFIPQKDRTLECVYFLESLK